MNFRKVGHFWLHTYLGIYFRSEILVKRPNLHNFSSISEFITVIFKTANAILAHEFKILRILTLDHRLIHSVVRNCARYRVTFASVFHCNSHSYAW